MASTAAGLSARPRSPPPSSSANPPGAGPASPPSKRDLKSWWKNFILPRTQEPSPITTESKAPQGIFGVPLRHSITYANVAISMYDDDGQSYVYGYVPIVVAKCGVFLKEKATGVEGIFRLSGSEKRIKELKQLFDSPDRYGKGLDWEGYTVHDAANVLRRYLNDLPEPVVPLELYDKFREPLRGSTIPPVADTDRPYFVDGFDENVAISKYQKLITELPPLNRQLLLYILDLLAVFAAKSEENRMTSQNLAAIFQPGMLSHPTHAMSPDEYRLNQCVVIFLIENQDHFILGMQGTAADEETRREVELGHPTTTTVTAAAAAAAAAPASTPATPTSNRRSGGGIYRSSSSASAGAQSVRRDGQIRRNRSVNSRHSKRDDNTGSTSSPVLGATQTVVVGGSLGRSNTVPSKKSPSVGSKYAKRRGDTSAAHSPSRLSPLPPAQLTETSDPSDYSSLAPPVVAVTAGAAATAATSSGLSRSHEKLLGTSQDSPTPQKERGLPSIFQRSPTDENTRRQPNKLKKKRIPGSEHPSAQSSNTSLPQAGTALSLSVELPNPMESAEHDEADKSEQRQSPSAPNGEVTSDSTPRASQIQPVTRSNTSLRPDDTPRAQGSPPASLHSSFNGGSDVEQSQSGDAQTGSSFTDVQDREKKSRWRLSRPRKEEGWNPREASSDRTMIRSNDTIDTSQTSFGSASNQQKPSRKSFTGGAAASADAAAAIAAAESQAEDSGRDEPKGPIGWIRNKYREAKENAEIRRNKSPTGENQHRHYGNLTAGGKGTDPKHDGSTADESNDSAYLWAAAEKLPRQPQPQPQPQPRAQAQPICSAAASAVEQDTSQSKQTPKNEPVEEPQQQPQSQPESTKEEPAEGELADEQAAEVVESPDVSDQDKTSVPVPATATAAPTPAETAETVVAAETKPETAETAETAVIADTELKTSADEAVETEETPLPVSTEEQEQEKEHEKREPPAQPGSATEQVVTTESAPTVEAPGKSSS